VISRN